VGHAGIAADLVYGAAVDVDFAVAVAIGVADVEGDRPAGDIERSGAGKAICTGSVVRTEAERIDRRCSCAVRGRVSLVDLSIVPRAGNHAASPSGWSAEITSCLQGDVRGGGETGNYQSEGQCGKGSPFHQDEDAMKSGMLAICLRHYQSHPVFAELDGSEHYSFSHRRIWPRGRGLISTDAGLIPAFKAPVVSYVEPRSDRDELS